MTFFYFFLLFFKAYYGDHPNGAISKSGGGGALCWRKSLLVTPGESYTVQVGKAGTFEYNGNTIHWDYYSKNPPRAGGESFFGNKIHCLAEGGNTDTKGTMKSFGGYFSNTEWPRTPDDEWGGGRGGSAAPVQEGVYNTGGGGAGGYSGNGGNGGGRYDVEFVHPNGEDGEGGGGGGG